MQASFTQRAARPAAAVASAPAGRRTAVVVRAAVAAKPAQIPVKTADGATSGSVDLSLAVAPPATAKGLVHRYLVYVQQNMRQGTASTKTRTDVRGGGKKPYKQKGTGNARRGSSTSPLFPGGGVSFGPKPKDWSIKMNKKERRLALATALQSAAPDMVAVDAVSVPDGKSKTLVQALAKAGADPSKKTLLIVASADELVRRAANNVEKLRVNTADALQVFDVLNADTVVLEKAALDKLQQLYAPAPASA